MIYKFIPPYINAKGRLVTDVDMPEDAENEYSEEIKRRTENPPDEVKPKSKRVKNTNT